MDSEEKQKQFSIQEEILEEKQSVCSQLNNQDILEESGEESDQLLPKPAFHIEDDNQYLTVEQRDAFTYIIAVRNQKQALTKNKKIKIASKKIQNITHSAIENVNKKALEEQENVGFKNIKQWRIQTVQHWKCVKQNLKYLHNNSLPQSLFKEKLNYQSILDLPVADKLCLNKWLTLSQIQDYLVDICNNHYQKLQNTQNNTSSMNEGYFNLWIYSLLALHQSYASYTNFQALASANAVIQRQYKLFQMISQNVDSQLRPTLNQSVIGWLVNVILLIDVFNQNFLKKYLSQTLLHSILQVLPNT